MDEAATVPAQSNALRLYDALEKYPWADDPEFQSGLTAILGSNSSPDQARELTTRARCFYYSRYVWCGFLQITSRAPRNLIKLHMHRKFNVNVDFDGYKAYRDTQPEPISPSIAASASVAPTNTETTAGATSTPSQNTPEPPAPYPTSFAHIVELISSGKPVPGIKDIPNTVLEGQGTAPLKPKRKKPWEKDETVAPVISIFQDVLETSRDPASK